MPPQKHRLQSRCVTVHAAQGIALLTALLFGFISSLILYNDVQAQSPTWQTQSTFMGTRDGSSQPRSMRGIALTEDGNSIYLGFIQGTSSSAVRKVSANIHSTLAPIGDASLIGNFSGTPTSTYDVFGPNPAYLGGNTGALEAALQLDGPQPRNLAVDDRGYVYVPNGSTPGAVTIYNSDLAGIAGTFGSFSSETGRGIKVLKLGSIYYAYFATNVGIIQRWNVTNVATPILDSAWGTTAAGLPANGSIDIKTVVDWATASNIGLTVDTDGTLYLVGTVGTSPVVDTVFKISDHGDLQTGIKTEVIKAFDVALFRDKLYITTYNGIASNIVVLNKSDLGNVATLSTGIARTASEGYAGIDVGADGRLYVVDQLYEIIPQATAYVPPVTSFNLSPVNIGNTRKNFDRVLVSSPVVASSVVVSNILGTGSGSISLEPIQEYYFVGDVVTLTATADVGSTFTGWSGAASGATNPITLTLDGDDVVDATFTLNQYVISLSSSPGAGGTTSGGGTVTHGATVNVTAVAAPSYMFVNWSEEGTPVSTDLTYSFAATQSRNLVANFKVPFVTWQTQSTYLGTRDGMSQPRSMRGIALSDDGTSLYLGLIQGSSSSAIRKVDSAIHADLVPAGDAALIGNFSGTPSDQYDVYGTNPAYTGGVTGAFEAALQLNGPQPRNIAIDDRGYVYVPNGGISGAVTIYSSDLTSIIGSFGAFSPATIGRGIKVTKVDTTYFAYFAVGDGRIFRYDVTNVASATLDTTWGTTAIGSAGNGQLNLQTVSGWVNAFASGLTVDADGTLYLAGGIGAQGAVFKISNNGDLQTAIKTDIDDAIDVAVFRSKLYVARYAGNTSSVSVLNKSDLSPVETLQTGIPRNNADGDNGYSGIDVGADGRLYLVDQLYEIIDSPTAYFPPATTFNPSPTSITGTRKNFDRVLVSSPVITPTTITVDLAGSGSGSVTISPTLSHYFVGDVVTLTASANPGSLFDGWSGALGGSTTPIMIMLDDSNLITATFNRIPYTLDAQVVGGGNVDLTPSQATYFYGDEVAATATANVGWAFVGWSGDLAGTDNPDSLIIDGNKVITATFTQIPYTLDAQVVGGGNVDLTPSQATYFYGDEVAATATANVGWAFVGWSGDLAGTDNPNSLIIDGNKIITATFAQGQYAVTVSANPAVGGNVVGGGIGNLGDTVRVTATPSVNYTFVNWTEGGTEVSVEEIYVFVATGNRTLVANFAELTSTTISVNKVVVGSGAFAPVGGWNFTLGDAEITIPAGGGNQQFTNLTAASYTLSEEADADYTTTVTCGASTVTGTSVVVTIALGDSLDCTFTNTLRSSSLTVTKVVINDEGGTAEVEDFPLFVNGAAVTSGVSNTLPSGTYTVSESNLGNYAPTFSGDCAANGVVTLAPGEHKNCIITNNEIAIGEKVAAISLVKTVGLFDDVCATDTTISVLPGTTVFYCYTVTNTGNVTLTEHTLGDSELGTLVDALKFNLAPGQTTTNLALGIQATDEILVNTTNTATWSGVATDEVLTASASAAATVTLGIESYAVTVAGTYQPPAAGGTTGGHMRYDINVLNTGTTIIKNLQLSFVVPNGTTFDAGEDAWDCADGSVAGTACTIVIEVLKPGEDSDIALALNIIVEIAIGQLVLEINAATEGTPISPTSGSGIVVVGPNAEQRTFIFLPSLNRSGSD